MYSSIADCREVLRLASWSCSRARGCSNLLVSCGVPSHVAGPSSCADGGGTVGSCSCCQAPGICAAGICAAKAALWLAVGATHVGVIWASADSRRAGGDHIRGPRLGGEVLFASPTRRLFRATATAGQKKNPSQKTCGLGGIIGQGPSEVLHALSNQPPGPWDAPPATMGTLQDVRPPPMVGRRPVHACRRLQA